MTAVINEDLLAKALKSDKLPSLPSVALEIVRLCKNEDAGVNDLADVVSMDPSLATKILRTANSTKYRRSQEFTDLHRACFVLGNKTLKIMALGFSVTQSSRHPDPGNEFDFNAFWAHSVAAAVTAREFAKTIGSSFENEAFICGLLGRIGQLSMAKTIPAVYQGIVSAAHTTLPSSSQELETLGFDHHELANQLLVKWELPDLLVKAIAGWNQPESAGEGEAIARIVRLADEVAKLLREKSRGTHLKKVYDLAERDFDMPQDEVDALIMVLNEEIQSLAKILDVNFENEDEYDQLLEDAREQMIQVSLQATLELQTASSDLELERERNTRLTSQSEELLRRSQMDSLTGIPNRGAFDQKLHQMVSARVGNHSIGGFAVMMVDVDHFKLFNDNHGHLIGDEVLKEVAFAIKQSLRPSDFVARYGGEEFVILLPDSGIGEMKIVGERTRRVVEQVKIKVNDGTELTVTASFGGAIGHKFDDVTDGIELVKLADQCLYQSKQRGRNCCSYDVFTPDPRR